MSGLSTKWEDTWIEHSTHERHTYGSSDRQTQQVLPARMPECETLGGIRDPQRGSRCNGTVNAPVSRSHEAAMFGRKRWQLTTSEGKSPRAQQRAGTRRQYAWAPGGLLCLCCTQTLFRLSRRRSWGTTGLTFPSLCPLYPNELRDFSHFRVITMWPLLTVFGNSGFWQSLSQIPLNVCKVK